MCQEVLHNDHTRGVGVVRVSGEYRLLSVVPFRPGEFLFEIEGEITHTPTRYSVQIDREAHIDLGESYDLEQLLDRYYWRFMNHSCQPNAAIHGRSVIALRPICPWEEITFDYNTTEYEIAEPFHCRCESIDCRKIIRGFKYLTRTERARLRPWLAPYLLSLLDEDPAAILAVHTPEGSCLR
jgi:hypothetical protein